LESLLQFRNENNIKKGKNERSKLITDYHLNPCLLQAGLSPLLLLQEKGTGDEVNF
jgi:hypothetical protein